MFTPQVELFQRGDELVVRADLPGLSPEEVQVEVEDGVLVISGERRNEMEDRREGFFHSERRYGAFQRAIPLPEQVNEEQVRAAFRDGVLEVTVPMPQPEQRPRGRRVQINAGGAEAASASRSGAAGADEGAGGAR
jgi:HSP20 family protein